MLMQLSYDRLMNIILKIDPLFIDSFLYFLSVSDPIFNTIGAEQQLRSALIMERIGGLCSNTVPAAHTGQRAARKPNIQRVYQAIKINISFKQAAMFQGK